MNISRVKDAVTFCRDELTNGDFEGAFNKINTSYRFSVEDLQDTYDFLEDQYKISSKLSRVPFSRFGQGKASITIPSHWQLTCSVSAAEVKFENGESISDTIPAGFVATGCTKFIMPDNVASIDEKAFYSSNVEIIYFSDTLSGKLPDKQNLGANREKLNIVMHKHNSQYKVYCDENDYEYYKSHIKLMNRQGV